MNPISYTGMLVKQRGESGLPFFVFAATAKSVRSWAEVRPTLQVVGGAQRMISSAHEQSLRNYVEDERNIIPTSITLALPEGSYAIEEFAVEDTEFSNATSLAVLQVRPRKSLPKPGDVIDGQHRLLALSDESIPLLATVILGASKIERALHFVVINNKAKRVPTDLVKAILGEMEPDERTEFEERVARIRLSLGRYRQALVTLSSDASSPFRDLIDWDLNRDGERIVKPLALESALKEVFVKLDVPDLDLDDALQILMALWRGIKVVYEDGLGVWGAESKLLRKASIVAISEFLVWRLNIKIEEGFDATNLDSAAGFAQQTLTSVPVEFWLVPWGRKSLDTSAGRELIRRALRDVRRATAQGKEDPVGAAAWFLNPPELDEVAENL